MNSQALAFDLVIGMDRSDRKVDLHLLDLQAHTEESATLATDPAVLQAWVADLRERFPQHRVALVLEQPANRTATSAAVQGGRELPHLLVGAGREVIGTDDVGRTPGIGAGGEPAWTHHPARLYRLRSQCGWGVSGVSQFPCPPAP